MPIMDTGLRMAAGGVVRASCPGAGWTVLSGQAARTQRDKLRQGICGFRFKRKARSKRGFAYRLLTPSARSGALGHTFGAAPFASPTRIPASSRVSGRSARKVTRDSSLRIGRAWGGVGDFLSLGLFRRLALKRGDCSASERKHIHANADRPFRENAEAPICVIPFLLRVSPHCVPLYSNNHVGRPLVVDTATMPCEFIGALIEMDVRARTGRRPTNLQDFVNLAWFIVSGRGDARPFSFAAFDARHRAVETSHLLGISFALDS